MPVIKTKTKLALLYMADVVDLTRTDLLPLSHPSYFWDGDVISLQINRTGASYQFGDQTFQVAIGIFWLVIGRQVVDSLHLAG